jgi:crotonobetainyl-CoA:carnitine CoA-transferase CaiB-like acyl-CoA transferase
MPAAAYLMTGLVAGRWGTQHQWHVPWKTFETSDGHVVIASSSEDQWAKICTALQRPELATDPRFATMQLRAAHREELYGILDVVLAGRTTNWWLAALAGAGAAAAPVNTMDRVFADLQVLHRQMVQQVQHTALGRIPQVGHAQKFSDTPAQMRLPPPVLGEHTVAVLEQLDDQTPVEGSA